LFKNGSAPPTSVSSSHDKLNGMKRLKQRVGYEEMNGRIGVPNGIGTPVVTALKGIVRTNFTNQV